MSKHLPIEKTHLWLASISWLHLRRWRLKVGVSGFSLDRLNLNLVCIIALSVLAMILVQHRWQLVTQQLGSQTPLAHPAKFALHQSTTHSIARTQAWRQSFIRHTKRDV